MVKCIFVLMLFTQQSIRIQQSRVKANAQKKVSEERQLRESLQARGVDSIKHVYQHKQQEETTLKQQYVCPLPSLGSHPHTCPSLPLHAAVCGSFLVLCA